MKPAHTLLALLLPLVASALEETMSIEIEGNDMVTYQALPMSSPQKGDSFKGSDFIHPLKTPSGFVLTECQPKTDHPHHFGLWWPWKHIEVDGRQILCWELQKGDGIIEARGAKEIPNGLIGESVYIDRKAPDGPTVRLHETTRMTVSDILNEPVKGYTLDLEITQKCAGEQPVTVTSYRYSGFSIRATAFWDKTNSTVLTSEGKDRYGANFSHARWVRMEGKTDTGEAAGLLMMSHPSNRAHPEKLRTWDKPQNGAIFINFNTVMEQPWHLEPGSLYTRNYRLFAYDGELSVDEAEALWQRYEKESR